MLRLGPSFFLFFSVSAVRAQLSSSCWGCALIKRVAFYFIPANPPLQRLSVLRLSNFSR